MKKWIAYGLAALFLFSCALTPLLVITLEEPNARYFVWTPHPYPSESVDDARKKMTLISVVPFTDTELKVGKSALRIKEVWVEKRAMLSQNTGIMRKVDYHAGEFFCFSIVDESNVLLREFGKVSFMCSDGNNFASLGLKLYFWDTTNGPMPTSIVLSDSINDRKIKVEFRLP